VTGSVNLNWRLSAIGRSLLPEHPVLLRTTENILHLPGAGQPHRIRRGKLAAHGEMLWRDLVYAARSLLRTPGFALTAVLVVALGVGANTAVFSLADFIFLQPLPYADANRLVKLWQGGEGGYAPPTWTR